MGGLCRRAPYGGGDQQICRIISRCARPVVNGALIRDSHVKCRSRWGCAWQGLGSNTVAAGHAQRSLPLQPPAGRRTTDERTRRLNGLVVDKLSGTRGLSIRSVPVRRRSTLERIIVGETIRLNRDPAVIRALPRPTLRLIRGLPALKSCITLDPAGTFRPATIRATQPNPPDGGGHERSASAGRHGAVV